MQQDCTMQKQEWDATDSTQKVPLDVTKETRGEIVEFLERGGAEWQMAATSVHNDVLLDSEERHE